MKVKIADIEIGDRLRSEVEDVEGLVKSIEKYGLIEPIVLTEGGAKGYQLVAGERRLRAHMVLEKEEIEAILRDNLDKFNKKMIELEENLRREDMPWPDVVKAQKTLHALYVDKHGQADSGPGEEGWGLKETAKQIGVSKATLSKNIKLADACETFPELEEQNTKTGASKKYKKYREQVANKIVGDKVIEEKEFPNVHHGTWQKILRETESDSVDMIILDPEWGIDIHESGAVGRGERWEDHKGKLTVFDDAEDALDWYDILLQESARVLKPNRHLIMFCAEQFVDFIRKLASKHLNVNNALGIWNKENPGRPAKYWLSPQHEVFLDMSKGKREPSEKMGTVLTHKRVPSTKKIHPTQKPPGLLRDLINVYTMPGETILDPTMGSGSTIVAAIQTGRKAIGIEKDEDTYKAALRWIKEVSDDLGLQESDSGSD